MRYEGNPKHTDPMQPGRRGTLCPPEIDHKIAGKLLKNSTLDGEQRYAVHEGRAYCASQHEAGKWHGWPVGWVEVPEPIRNAWKKARRVKRSEIKKFWRV
jgi:hypothetical protein